MASNPTVQIAKDAQLIAGLVAGQTISATAEAMGVSRQSAHNRLQRMEQDGTVADVMTAQGLTVGLLAQRLRRKLDAKRKQYIVADREIHERVHDDHATQMDAIKVSLRVLGIDAGERNPGSIGVAMSFSPSGCQLAIRADANSSVNVSSDTPALSQSNSNESVTLEHQLPRSTVEGTGKARAASPHTGRGKITTRGRVPSSNRSSKRPKARAKVVPAKRRSSCRWVD